MSKLIKDECLRTNSNNCMNSDNKKCRSFLAMLFASGELQRWAALSKQEIDHDNSIVEF